jgi:hypothetical protein
MKRIDQGGGTEEEEFVISMNRYGEPRNDNYMVNVCDDVELFKRTHKDLQRKQTKCVKNGTNDMRKENLRTPITHPSRT